MWSSLSMVVSQGTIYDWLLLASVLLILIYIAGIWNYDYFSRRGILHKKPFFPFIGNILHVFFGFDTFPDFFQKITKFGKGHSVVGLFEFQSPHFVILSPELIKIITVKEFDHFMNHRRFVTEKMDPLFGNNLFFLEDQRWRDMRTTLSPAFTSSKIKGMFPLVSKCAQQMVDHLKEKYRESPENENQGMETDMKNLFSRMGNDVIATVAFGVQCDSLKEPKNEFYEYGKKITSFTALQQLTFVLLLAIPKLAEVLKIPFLNQKATFFLDSLVHETIRERKQKGIFRPDMLQLLMQAREGELKAEKEDQHESENIGDKNIELTDGDVTAQAIIFFFAGFETVSTALCFTTYQLSHNPEVQKRLQQEVDAVWEKTGGKPAYEDIQRMKYLDQVISESLRMHPPNINLERMCRKDITLPAIGASPAFTICKGHIVSIPSIGIHYNEELWPDPERFDPERFSDENKHNIKPFSYMPFGLGPRICIGQRFALVEVKLAIVYLVRNFSLTPSPKTKHPLQYSKGFNSTIQGGFWSYLSPRSRET